MADTDTPQTPSPPSLAPESAPPLSPLLAGLEDPQPEPAAPPAPEATPQEGEDTGDETPWYEPYTKALSEAESEEAAFEHEAFKPFVERIREDSHREGLRAGQKRAQPIAQAALTAFDTLADTPSKLAQALESNLESGRMDADDLNQVFQAHPQAAEVLRGITTIRGFWQGFNYFLGQLHEAEAIDQDTLDDTFQQVQTLQLMTFNPKTTEDEKAQAVKEVIGDVLRVQAKQAQQAGYERGKKDGIALGRRNAQDEIAALARQNGAPVADTRAGRVGTLPSTRDITIDNSDSDESLAAVRKALGR